MAPTTSRGSLRTRTIPADSTANLGSCADRNSDIRSDECWRVANSVTYHRDILPPCLKPLDGGGFVGGKHFGGYVIDTNAARDRVRYGFRIACDYRDARPEPLEFLDRIS